jgi:uncharacterized protein involved in exopolysaccharide biosynthesis
MSDNRSHEVNLLDLIAFVLRWRTFLFTIMVVVCVAVGIVSMFLTPMYRSEAVIRASEKSSEGLGGLLASKLSGLGGIGFAPAMGELPGEVLVSVLRSRWMAERAIKELSLREAYRMPKAPIDDVIAVFKQRSHFELEPRAQTVLVYADDADPSRAQAMTEFLVNTLDARNSELKSAAARREREFIGQRLEEAKQTLVLLEDSLSRFQMETGVLDLEEQVKATIGAAATLEAQRLALQSEWEMSQQLLAPGNPELVGIRLRLASLDSSLQQLVVRKREADRDFDFLIRLKDTPAQGLAYLRLMRDIEIQQTLVALFIQKYETAKIDEQRNTPTVLRLDPPSAATKRVWPRRGLMVGVAALAALVFGTAAALIIEFFRRAASDPSHPQYGHVMRVRESLNLRSTKS